MPVFISFAAVLHILLLHQLGSSNPLTSGNIKEIIKLHP
jgi:quinol-cytochrome oxidoreductase complex cytochrome b subunit